MNTLRNWKDQAIAILTQYWQSIAKFSHSLTKPLIQYWRQVSLFRGLTLLVITLGTILLIVLPARSQPVILTFLMNAPEVAPFRPVIAEFERRNPGIRLNMIEGPNASNLVEDLNTSAFLLGDSPYDLLNLDVTWTAKFAAAGWLTDLSNLVSPEELAAFLPADIAAGRYNDRLYRLPWRTDASMLFYRRDLIEQAGLQPPETFSDLLQISQTLQASNAARWGFVWQGRQYEGLSTVFIEALEGYGGYWVDPETNQVGLDRPESIAAVQFLVDTIQKGISPGGVTTYQEDEARRLFQSGNTVFMRNWPYAWALLNEPESPVRGKVSIQPMVHAPNYESASCLGGWGWGISSTTRHPQEAWKAVQFLTSAEAQRLLILDTGYLPSRRSLYNDPELLRRYAFFPTVLQVLSNPAIRPPIAQYAQASDILQRYLSAAIAGRLTPQAAMASAAQETRVLLEGANR